MSVPKPYDVDALIAYHQAGLDQYRQYIGISAQTLEEQTIQALQDLKKNDGRIATLVKEIDDCRMRTDVHQEDGSLFAHKGDIIMNADWWNTLKTGSTRDKDGCLKHP